MNLMMYLNIRLHNATNSAHTPITRVPRPYNLGLVPYKMTLYLPQCDQYPLSSIICVRRSIQYKTPNSLLSHQRECRRESSTTTITMSHNYWIVGRIRLWDDDKVWDFGWFCSIRAPYIIYFLIPTAWLIFIMGNHVKLIPVYNATRGN